MSIRSMVTDYLDKIVDARFKRDTQGRLVFFPWGFGSGRLVPDATVEAQLRKAYRRQMIAIFVLAIPVVSALSAVYHPTGMAFVGFIAICAGVGFLSQLYPVWLSRNLPRSQERISYPNAMVHSLDRFGWKFLTFGLVTSVIFAAGAALMLAFDSSADKVVMVICIAIFAPLAAVYAVALRKRNRGTAKA